MLLTCKCNAIVRVPSLPKVRVRCGACQHVFTPRELCAAKPEEPPKQPEPDFELIRQRDINQEDQDGKCPECFGELRSDGYCVKCGQFYDLED